MSQTNLMSNGHTFVARGLSQLAENLMIRDGDPNVANIKENKRIMYYAIDENNLQHEFGDTLFDKMNENGLLIALESTNSVLNFGEKSASPATGNDSG